MALDTPLPTNNEKAAIKPSNRTSRRPSPPPAFVSRFFSPSLAAGWRLSSLKTLIRCTLVFAAGHVLIFAEASLNLLGQAAFFCAIVTIMLPPSMAISLFLLACTTLLVGMLLGWAWGCAGMAASLSVRDATVVASQYQKAQSQIATNPDASFQSIVFEGAFLDARASAVFGAFFFIGTFAMGALRAHIPKLGLLSIFATIIMDVMFSYGPLFPTAQYNLPTMLILPTACYVAMAVASLLFIFPETMSHVWIRDVVETFLEPSLSLLAVQDSVLTSSFPLDGEEFASKVQKGKDIRRGIVAGVQGILGGIGTIDLEISVGKLGPGDLKEISSKILALTPKTLALVSFSSVVADMLEADALQEAAIPMLASYSSSSTNIPPTRPHGTSRLAEIRRKIKEREARHGHDLSVLLPILAATSAPLRSACAESVDNLSGWLFDLNKTRWRLGKKGIDEAGVEQAKEKLERLRITLREFKETEREKLVRGPFGKFFEVTEDGHGSLKAEFKDKANDSDVLTARSLFLCFVFTTTLESYAEALLDFFAFSLDLRQKRPQSRLWFPTGFGKIARKIQSRHGVGSGAALGSSGAEAERMVEEESIDSDDDDEEEEEDKDDSAVHARDPDSTTTSKGAQKLSRFLRWFGSHEGLFALRHAVVSIGIWIIAVHPNSAQFNYENKGLWALIMAQTGLGLFAGNMITNFVLRMGGTAVGLVMGMLAWYIGAGRGNGNPYGLTIISSFLGLPILYARIVLPPTEFVSYLMAGVTMVLIVGYSYIDTHLIVSASSGIGASVAWKRALLVFIGFVAAFLVTCFPKITSARVMVRKTAANVVERIGSLLASEVEALLLEEARFSPSNVPSKESDDIKKQKRIKKIGARFITIAAQLQGIVPVIDDARREPRLGGPWPKDKYDKLFAIQWKLLVSISLLSEAFSQLDVKWCSILARKTPFLNANLLSDVFSTLAIISTALKDSNPLPAGLPSLRERLIYHQRHSAVGRAHAQNAFEADLEDQDLEAPSADKFRSSSIGIKELSMAVLTDPQLPLHSTAVVALSSIYACLDELTEITRSLVGETSSLSALEDWRSRSVRQEEEGMRRAEEKGSRR